MSEVRSPLVIAGALSALIATADSQCVPLNLHSAVLLLDEFANAVAAQAPAEAAQSLIDSISALSARVDALHQLLVDAGVIPAPAPAPTPAPAEGSQPAGAP